MSAIAEGATITISNTSSKTDKAMNWKVLLLNCDCHSFADVEKALVKIIKCTPEKAQEYAVKVHKEGCCVVFNGHKEVAEFKHFHLTSEGLEADLTQ